MVHELYELFYEKYFWLNDFKILEIMSIGVILLYIKNKTTLSMQFSRKIG